MPAPPVGSSVPDRSTPPPRRPRHGVVGHRPAACGASSRNASPLSASCGGSGSATSHERAPALKRARLISA